MENSPRSTENKRQEYWEQDASFERQANSAPPKEIGRFLVSNETDEIAASNREAAIGKRVETMSRTEVMDISGKIMVEGTSLKRIYEANLISENGLRRLVGEYLRTGDIRGLLKLELLEREIDFERDPQLRDKIRRQISEPGGKTLNILLKEAGLNKPGETKTATKPENDALMAAARTLRGGGMSPQKRRLIDVAFISIISVLLLLVIIIAISRA